jgi:hypothetical protein
MAKLLDAGGAAMQDTGMAELQSLKPGLQAETGRRRLDSNI